MNALQIDPRRDMTLEVIQLAMTGGAIFHASRLFGVSTPEQATAIMLKGYELGLSMSASFEFIQVIQGKPTLSPRGAMAIIQASGLLKDLVIKEDANSCTVTMQRVNGTGYTCTFTMDDARKAGLVKEGGAWQTYPANMMRWRAIGFCADMVFPDILAGMKTADQFGATVNSDGDIIEGVVVNE